jgi:DNA ligase (NAD+)
MSNFSFLPTICPSCGTALIWAGVDLKCTNLTCGATQIKSLESFLIKCGVEGVTATSLENWNVLTFDDMLSFVSDGSKSQDNFVKEIKKNVFSKSQEDIFSCMTFNGAGRKNIMKILEFYSFGDGNNLDVIFTSNMLYVTKSITGYPEGIGQKIIDKIAPDWKSNLHVMLSIIKDKRWKPEVKTATNINTNSSISGKSFCITGTLTKGRKEFEKMITDNGGTISSVSKKLNYLLAGADAGGKLDKAKSLGVIILTEDEFMGMI